MPDQVRAKLHKAMGLHLVRTATAADDNPETVPAGAAKAARAAALDHLRRALALNDKCGVKKDIERLERELKKATEAEPAAPAPAPAPAHDFTVTPNTAGSDPAAG